MSWVRNVGSAVAALVTLGWFLAGAPWALASSWSIQPLPKSVSHLTGVSCAAPGACTAVGGDGAYYESRPVDPAPAPLTLTGPVPAAVVAFWDGTSWSISHAPGTELLGASCLSRTACTVVGTAAGGQSLKALAESHTPTTWSLQPMTSLAFSKLDGVSCTSGRACTAVGTYTTGGGLQATLAERWNGTRWIRQSTPAPIGTSTSHLKAVSCTSTSDCTAAGSYYHFAGDDSTLAEHWNGKRWSIEKTVSPSVFSEFAGVSCAAPTACTAVGRIVVGPITSMNPATAMLVERWNGKRWSVEQHATPAGAVSSALTAVSCPSRSVCTAVGSYTAASGVKATLAERWNGQRWVIQRTPNPAGATNSDLRGVSCASPSVCTAVGDYMTKARLELTLVERWNGHG